MKALEYIELCKKLIKSMNETIKLLKELNRARDGGMSEKEFLKAREILGVEKEKELSEEYIKAWCKLRKNL